MPAELFRHPRILDDTTIVAQLVQGASQGGSWHVQLSRTNHGHYGSWRGRPRYPCTLAVDRGKRQCVRHTCGVCRAIHNFGEAWIASRVTSWVPIICEEMRDAGVFTTPHSLAAANDALRSSVGCRVYLGNQEEPMLGQYRLESSRMLARAEEGRRFIGEVTTRVEKS